MEAEKAQKWQISTVSRIINQPQACFSKDKRMEALQSRQVLIPTRIAVIKSRRQIIHKKIRYPQRQEVQQQLDRGVVLAQVSNKVR